MPKETFYRLPDEKRERIMVAAEREFLENSFEAASINRIIKEAAIPRGSFYQYFEDKKDIFLYIVDTHKNEAFDFVENFIKDCNGDIFAFMRMAINFLCSSSISLMPIIQSLVNSYMKNLLNIYMYSRIYVFERFREYVYVF